MAKPKIDTNGSTYLWEFETNHYDPDEVPKDQKSEDFITITITQDYGVRQVSCLEIDFTLEEFEEFYQNMKSTRKSIKSKEHN